MSGRGCVGHAGLPGMLQQFLSAAWNSSCRRDPEPRVPGLASMAPSEIWATGYSKEPRLSICLLTAFWKLQATTGHSVMV